MMTFNFYDFVLENNKMGAKKPVSNWTPEEVELAGKNLGINLGSYDKNEIMLGMKIESVHGSMHGNDVNVTGDQCEPTLKLVIGRLRGNMHYYSMVQQLENQNQKNQLMESVSSLTNFEKYVNNVRNAEDSEKIAAGVLPICKTTGRILLVKRSNSASNPGTWSGIGGKLEEEKGESEESIQDVVRREFFEETGCKSFYSLIPSYIYETSNGGFKYYNFIGIFEEEFQPILNKENDDYKWFTLDEASTLSNDEIHFGIKLLFLNDPDIIKKYAR